MFAKFNYLQRRLAFCVLLIILLIATTLIGSAKSVKATSQPVSFALEDNDLQALPITLEELELLRAFSTEDGNGWTIDFVSAKANGISEQTLTIAQETLRFQEAILSGEFKSQSDIDNAHTQYQALSRFWDTLNLARETNPSAFHTSSQSRVANPCGTYTNPVPNQAGTWVGLSTSNPARWFQNNGYHLTAGYAGGDGSVDYTKGRSYNGCSSPRFRYHGRIWGRTSLGTQTPECNPEIRSYSWPYWDWGAYCFWWHSTH